MVVLGGGPPETVVLRPFGTEVNSADLPAMVVAVSKTDATLLQVSQDIQVTYKPTAESNPRRLTWQDGTAEDVGNYWVARLYESSNPPYSVEVKYNSVVWSFRIV